MNRTVMTRALFSACLLLAALPAAAERVVVEDAMTDEAGCTGTCHDRTQNGGNFRADGWKQSGLNAQLVYDLGPGGVDCGQVEFFLTSFDPTQQVEPNDGVDEYHILLILGEDSSGKRCDLIPTPSSSLNLMVVRFDGRSIEAHKRFRIGAHPDCTGGEAYNRYTAKPGFTWDLDRTYRVRLDWTPTSARVRVTEVETSTTRDVSVNTEWPAGTADPTWNLRYLFLGKPNCACGQKMKGPVWYDLTVTDAECFADCTCTPGETRSEACGECGTRTRTCWVDCEWGAWGECVYDPERCGEAADAGGDGDGDGDGGAGYDLGEPEDGIGDGPVTPEPAAEADDVDGNGESDGDGDTDVDGDTDTDTDTDTAACTKDADCSGDMICVEGRCWTRMPDGDDSCGCGAASAGWTVVAAGLLVLGLLRRRGR